MHQGLSGNGSGGDGGGFPVARIAASASRVVPSRQQQPQRAASGPRPDAEDVRGDRAEPGQRRGPALRVGQRVLEIAAERRPGQELQAAQAGCGGPAEQVGRVTGHRAHPGGERVQQVGRVRRRIGLAQPVPPQPVDQHDPQRVLPRGGRAEQVDGGQRAAGPPADDRDHRPASRRQAGARRQASAG